MKKVILIIIVIALLIAVALIIYWNLNTRDGYYTYGQPCTIDSDCRCVGDSDQTHVCGKLGQYPACIEGVCGFKFETFDDIDEDTITKDGTDSEKISYKVVTKENLLDESETDIFILKEDGSEEFLMTLDNVYSRHIHTAEYHNNHLYIIRRVGYDGYPDDDWADELWMYGNNVDSGRKIYSGKGINFRVSLDEKFVAIEDSKLLFINSDNYKIEKEYEIEELVSELNRLLIDRSFSSLFINIEGWSDNSKNLWLSLNWTAFPQAIVNINVESWKIKQTDIEDLSLSVYNELNLNTGRIVYDNYPVFFDVISREDWIANGENKVTLYIYDLFTKESTFVDETINSSFKAKWVDDDTIEYKKDDETLIFNLN